MSGETSCRRCGAALSHKDSRSIVMRTVYGNGRQEPEIVVVSLPCGAMLALV